MQQRPPIIVAPPDLAHPTRAKIIATLGPASDAPDTVRRLIDAGVSAFRLNFSHGTMEEHARRLAAVRAVAAEMKRPVAVFGDLCGPKIRVGFVPKDLSPTGGIELEAGQDVLFDRTVSRAGLIREGQALTAVLPITYPELIDEATPGHRVLLNDGAVRTLAMERAHDGSRLRARVIVGGLITSGKGINLPDTELNTPAITPRDWEWVAWAVEHNLDFLALSFVRRAAEVHELKDRLGGMCAVDQAASERGQAACIPVIAKIEKPQAVADLDAIVDAADAVMVARGDLGVEMDIAQVPIVQKQILARCSDWGKPCIVATQMLETMIESATPTRAEASDVANAVFDGADAVMLSAETAVGKHPPLVVETMRRIIGAAEARLAQLPPQESPPARLIESRYATAALAHGAWQLARDIGARLIICWSQSGGTARYLSQNDFRIPIVAYSSSETATRRMALLKGVTPIHAAPPRSGKLSDFTDMAEADMLARGWVEQGEPMILLAGKPLGQTKATNSLAILYTGDPTGGYRSHTS